MNRKLLVAVIAATFVLAVGIGSYFAFRKQPPEKPPTSSAPAEQVAKPAPSFTLAKKVDMPGVQRPEIVVTDSRAFVVYLEPSTSGDNSFKVRVYDRDLATEITSKTLVSTTPEYGHPTDIRVVSDGACLYAFYETVNGDKTYLFGAKYMLDDAFERVAFRGPITSSVMFKFAKPGDEKTDDPAPMLDGKSVYVMTRYKSSLAAEGETRYRLYEFDPDLSPRSEFDLDLSAWADGEARQASLVCDDGFYYVALPTTTGNGRIVENVEWTAPSDILVVKLDRDWNVVDSRIIASESGYTEGYVTGLIADGDHFYVTCIQVILGEEFSSIIKVFDKDWNPVLTEKYKDMRDTRPSIFVTADRVYAGNSERETQKGEVYIFEKSNI